MPRLKNVALPSNHNIATKAERPLSNCLEIICGFSKRKYRIPVRLFLDGLEVGPKAKCGSYFGTIPKLSKVERLEKCQFFPSYLVRQR